MKLKNLSRLTALLMALSIFCGVAFAEGTAVYDVTGNFMEEIYKYMVTINMYFNGKCLKCAYALAKNGVTTWPADGDDCLYEQLEKLSSDSERYTLLTNASESLRTAYVEAHAYHNGKLLCTCDEMHAPGNDHAAGCPWYEANVVNGSNSTLEITVPDGAFDGAYTLSAANITDAETLAKVKAAVDAYCEANTPLTAGTMDAYDISFLVGGEKKQPSKAVTLNFDLSNFPTEDGTILREVFHLVQNADGTYTAESVGFTGTTIASLALEATEFSVYVVAEVGETEKVVSVVDQTQADGNYTYKISLGDEKILYWDKYIYTTTRPGGNNGQENIVSGLKYYVWAVEDPEHVLDYIVYSDQKPSGENWRANYPYIKIFGLNPGKATLTLKYYDGNSEKKFTVVVTVNEPGFYIEDQIAENGCLVPAGSSVEEWGDDVTYTWTRSDNEQLKNGALINTEKIKNGLNVALDQGGATNKEDGTGYNYITYTLTAKKSDGTTVTAQYKVMYGSVILNPSFELPRLDGQNMSLPNGTENFVWKTTGVGLGSYLAEDLEVIVNGGAYSSGIKAREGKQFVELNAQAYGTLYQDMVTAPGATLTWQFSHANRTDTTSQNNMYVIMASTATASFVIDADDVADLLKAVTSGYDGKTYEATLKNRKDAEGNSIKVKFAIWKISDKNEGGTRHDNYWYDFAGTYKVPEGQYLTRLFFASDTADKNGSTVYEKTYGNLIDAAEASEMLTYKVEYYLNGELSSTYSQGSNDDPLSERVYSNVVATYFDEITKQNYNFVGATVNGVAYSGDVGAAPHNLYVAPYVITSDEGEPANVFKLYFVKKGVKVNKQVDIEGWEAMSTDQQKDLLGSENKYKTTFTLKKDQEDSSESTLLELAPKTTTEQMSGSTSFQLEDTAEGEYTVTESTPPQLDGYVLTTKVKVGDVEEKDGTSGKVTVSANDPVPEITFINTYTKIKTTSLTIEKIVIGTSVASESFIFTVSADGETPIKVVINGTGSVTINGLKVGTEYTVTEDTSWSNRYGQTEYSVKDGKITLVADAEKNVVTVTNSGRNDQWLHNETSVTNKFTK